MGSYSMGFIPRPVRQPDRYLLGHNYVKGYWGGVGDANLAYALPDDYESGTPSTTARVNRNLNRLTNGK